MGAVEIGIRLDEDVFRYDLGSGRSGEWHPWPEPPEFPTTAIAAIFHEGEITRTASSIRGPVTFANEKVMYVVLLVPFERDSEEEVSIPLRFRIDASSAEELWARRSPIHHHFDGALEVDQGDLYWRPTYRGSVAREQVRETVIRWLNAEDAPDLSAIEHYVNANLSSLWCGVLANRLSTRAGDEPIPFGRYHPAMKEALRHIWACDTVAAGGVCTECWEHIGRISREFNDRTWQTVTDRVQDRMDLHMFEPGQPSPTLLDDLGRLMSGEASRAERKESLNRIERARTADIVGGLPSVFEHFNILERATQHRPWTLLAWIKLVRDKRPDEVRRVLARGWSFEIGGKRSRKIQAVIRISTLSEERILAVLAVWELVIHRALRLADLDRTIDALRLPRRIVPGPVRDLVQSVGLRIASHMFDQRMRAGRNDTPATLERTAREMWSCLREMPCPSTDTRDTWIDAYRKMPFIRELIARDAPQLDPTSPHLLLFSRREFPPEQTLVDAAEAPSSPDALDHAREVVGWYFTAAATTGSVDVPLPPAPRAVIDGRVSSDSAYWKNYLWNAEVAPRDLLHELWPPLVEALIQRARADDTFGGENQGWMGLHRAVQDKGLVPPPGLYEQIKVRLVEVLEAESKPDERLLTLLNLVVTLSGDGDASGVAELWVRVHARLRDAGLSLLRRNSVKALTRHPSIGTIIEDREVIAAVAANLREIDPYDAVLAIRCVLTAAELLGAVDWLMDAQAHGAFWKSECQEIAPPLAELLEDEGVAKEELHARMVALMEEIARKAVGPEAFLNSGHRSLALTSLAQLDRTRAENAAGDLIGSGDLEVVAQWARRLPADEGREFWMERLVSMAADAETSTLVAVTSIVTRLVAPTASIVDLAPRLARYIEDRLHTAKGLDDTRHLLNGLSRLQQLAPCRPSTGVRAGVERLLKSADRSTRTLYAVDHALALYGRFPGADDVGSAWPLDDVVAYEIERILRRKPTRELEEAFDIIDSAKLTPDHRAGLVIGAAGGSLYPPPAVVSEAVAQYIDATLRPGSKKVSTPWLSMIGSAVGFLRKLIRDIIEPRVVELCGELELPTVLLTRRIFTGGWARTDLVEGLSNTGSDVTRETMIDLWRVFAVIRVRSVIESAVGLLHDLKSVGDDGAARTDWANIVRELERSEYPLVLPVLDPLEEVASRVRKRVEDGAWPPDVGVEVVGGPSHRTDVSLDDIELILDNAVSNAVKHGIPPVVVRVDKWGVSVASRALADERPELDSMNLFLRGNASSRFRPGIGMRLIQRALGRNGKLHAFAKIEHVNGVPYFVFSLRWRNPES